MKRAGLVLTLITVAIGAPANAATFTVDTLLDTEDANPGDGLCADADTGACSLRAAVEESNALEGVDMIEIAAGVYLLSIAGLGEDASTTGDLDVTDDVTVRGAGSAVTTIDADAIDRVLDLHAAAKPVAVRLEALTVRNGFLSMQNFEPTGAGIRVADTVSLALEDVVVRDNHLTGATGGIAIDSAGCIAGAHVRVLDNRDTAKTGSGLSTGGIVLREGSASCLDLSDSEIRGNFADYAGGIYADGAQITLRRSLVADNEGRFAGAMLPNSGDTVLLENVTLSGNRGITGAIANDGGSIVTLVNCTVTGNGPAQGSANVGGLGDVHGGFGLIYLSNTIVYGNGPGFIADDCDRANSVGGGNMIGDSARCHFDSEPSDQLDVDPGLGPLADNGGYTKTHLPGANAIDRGQAAPCPADDQRGAPRPTDGDGDGTVACDAGAVEVDAIGVEDTIFANGFDA